MITFKRILIVFLLFQVNITIGQITFDMKLSETSSEHKLIPHSDSLNFPDSISVTGYISRHKKGICGDVCAGGTIKMELANKIEGYNNSYIYIVTACATGESTSEKITLNATKYTGKETECFYKDVVEVIDSKGIPYYKISKEETSKITFE